MPLLLEAERKWLVLNLPHIDPASIADSSHSEYFLDKYPEYNEDIHGYWGDTSESIYRLEQDRWDHHHRFVVEEAKPFAENGEPRLCRNANPAAHEPAFYTLTIGSRTKIPEHVLRGPWTEDKLLYLFWAYRSGLYVDYMSSTSGEACDSLDVRVAPLTTL